MYTTRIHAETTLGRVFIEFQPLECTFDSFFFASPDSHYFSRGTRRRLGARPLVCLVFLSAIVRHSETVVLSRVFRTKQSTVKRLPFTIIRWKIVSLKELSARGERFLNE